MLHKRRLELQLQVRMRPDVGALPRWGPGRTRACVHAEDADAVPMTSPLEESSLTSLKKKLAGTQSTAKEC